MLVAQAADLADAIADHWVLLATAAGLLIALLVLWRIAAVRRRDHPDLEKQLREDLAEYPPPPAPSRRPLLVNGTPARLRLVVVAPAGKHQDPISPDDVPELLNEAVRGLGEYVAADRPRVRVWPPQLSVAGFAPTFHRLVTCPDAARWVKLAGPARTGKRVLLLGLVVAVDEPSRLGDVAVETTEWRELVQAER
jgi:hypothetical protein